MASSLTIFGKKADYSDVLAKIRSTTAFPVDITGDPDSWQSATVKGPQSTLTFNPMKKTRPGDSFSKIILGAANFFRRIKTDAVANQNFLKDSIFKTALLIGVVAEPELIEGTGDFDLIFEVAASCDGLIFNGNGMVDASGDLILDSNGEYDRLLA